MENPIGRQDSWGHHDHNYNDNNNNQIHHQRCCHYNHLFIALSSSFIFPTPSPHFFSDLKSNHLNLIYSPFFSCIQHFRFFFLSVIKLFKNEKFFKIVRRHFNIKYPLPPIWGLKIMTFNTIRYTHLRPIAIDVNTTEYFSFHFKSQIFFFFPLIDENCLRRGRSKFSLILHTSIPLEAKLSIKYIFKFLNLLFNKSGKKKIVIIGLANRVGRTTII